MKNTAEQINLQTTIPISLAGLRLDQALAEIFPQYSRSRLQSWLQAQQISVNGQYWRPRDKVQGHEEIIIQASIESHSAWEAEKISLDIIHEDKAILIINKPVGMVVHPAAGNYAGTLVNALLHYHPPLASLPRAGIVHRLDKDTSGLLVVAKTLTAHTALIKQLQARRIKREYEAIVCGNMTAGGTVDAPIGRHSLQRKRMAVTDSGKPAISHYRVLERFRAHTRIKVMLETGRTHQIRVHMTHIRHPLIGDSLYGKRLQIPAGATQELISALRQFHRQALHAARLGFLHPLSGEYREWTAPLPTDLQNLLSILRSDFHSQ